MPEEPMNAPESPVEPDEAAPESPAEQPSDAPTATATVPPPDAPSESDQTRKEKIDRILAMDMPVIVKLAEKQMTLSSVLKLNIGSVLNFEKDAYQSVDLMVNNAFIGQGQTVKVGENFGLRISQIGTPADTLQSLGLTQDSEAE